MKKAGRVDVSPATIHKYQQKSAMKNRTDAKLFAALEDLTDVFLFRKAERTNNVDLFFSAMRLTLPLLAFTNASWYVYIYWIFCNIGTRQVQPSRLLFESMDFVLRLQMV